MNMREAFLNSNNFTFKETGVIWKGNPILFLEKSSYKGKYDIFLSEHQIYLGLTSEPLIYLEKLQLLLSIYLVYL